MFGLKPDGPSLPMHVHVRVAKCMVEKSYVQKQEVWGFGTGFFQF